MYAREKIYGIAIAALLMTACSQNETEPKTVPTEEPVAISFSFSAQDNQATTRGEAENAQLRNTGFGVFATVEGSAYPNLMYNQQVTYTYLADDANNGYWSYSPVKFWPMTVNGAGETVPQNVTFCAYAPYAEPNTETGNTGATFGITKISKNDDAAPYLIYKRYTNPKDSVNLLWDCQVPTTSGSIKLRMRHALARVAVSIKLESAPASGTRVLLNRVTLSGNIAESGKLNLAGVVANFIGTSSTEITAGGEQNPTIENYSGTAKAAGNVVLYSDKEYIWTGSVWQAGVIPVWTDQVTPGTISIYTDCDPETNTASWGIINNDIRYVKDLPYSWQPAGLNATNYQNVITIDGHGCYLYLIPQANLTLKCTVNYTILSSDGTAASHEKIFDDVEVPLNGNTKYYLNLKL